MYAVNLPCATLIGKAGKTEILPQSYGPYDTANEAVGVAVDFLRTNYDEEPQLRFENYGDDKENIKVISWTNDEDDYYATVNKLW